MKKVFLLILFVAAAFAAGAQQKAKYVFYFIGDGMGFGIVNATEHYKAFNNGNKYGSEPLLFTSFPVMGLATTNSATRYITDSAAAGTALATGEKTSPGTIGMDADHKNPLRAISYDAKDRGKAVGILTSVSIDHATPASFFASQPSRDMAFEIAMDGVGKNIDLFGGSGYVNPEKEGVNINDAYIKDGYAFINGKAELNKLSADKKAIITERKGASAESYAYAIDRKDEDMSLSELVESSISYLEKRGGKNGFFMMAEGGKIDWAQHSNDARTAILEVLDFDAAIAVAYEFYKKHPKETLIIVTADHETGGFSIGRGEKAYSLSMELVDCQKNSVDKISEKVKNAGSWEDCMSILKSDFGLFEKVEVSDKEKEDLILAYYRNPASVASVALNIYLKKCGFGYTSGTHTGIPVPVYAIGAGSDIFRGRNDNTDIPNKIRTLL